MNVIAVAKFYFILRLHATFFGCLLHAALLQLIVTCCMLLHAAAAGYDYMIMLLLSTNDCRSLIFLGGVLPHLQQWSVTLASRVQTLIYSGVLPRSLQQSVMVTSRVPCASAGILLWVCYLLSIL